jgi:hypothetical protein
MLNVVLKFLMLSVALFICMLSVIALNVVKSKYLIKKIFFSEIEVN